MRTHFASTLQIARVAIALTVFGVCAPLLALIALPAAYLVVRDRREREVWMQRTVHRAARVYLRFIDRLETLKVVGYGVDRLREVGPHLVVANHPTLVDAVVLLALMPQADCIVSKERANNILLRGLIRSCGYLRNDGGIAIVDECADRLRAGRSLLVFPEGTRSPKHGLRRLHRGAAHIALRAPCDLLPVTITCNPPMLGKEGKWYDLADRASRMTVVVREPIATRSVLDSGVAFPVAARRLTSQLRESLEKGLDIVDVGIT
jgi:1-acyl-sn-glycerol-3-phosphate acyltransferase